MVNSRAAKGAGQAKAQIVAYFTAWVAQHCVQPRVIGRTIAAFNPFLMRWGKVSGLAGKSTRYCPGARRQKENFAVPIRFGNQLKAIEGRLMNMGGLVELQIKFAIEALTTLDAEAAQQIAQLEMRVNELEVELDGALTAIIASRELAPKDVRLLIGISKATSNLERIGDEANKIGRMVQKLIAQGAARNLPILELRYAGEFAAAQLRSSLDAFVRMDVGSVVDIIRQDHVIDQEFEGYTRKLVTYMMEDPRKISSIMEMMFLAKSIERIGDHAKNLAELVVYMVNGKDVRHTSVAQVQSAVDQRDEEGA